jgi:thioredoxin
MTIARGFRGGVTAALVLIVVSTATAQYSGGRGTAQGPYQIATATDLIALGETPSDYDKHFILTADIDLDPNLSGRKIFDKAVIGQFVSESEWVRPSGTAFAGVFDGGGYKISRMTITGKDYLGLFGRLASGAEVRNLAVVDVHVIGSGNYISGLVGFNEGRIRACFANGEVHGGYWVGGMVGDTYGTIVACYAQAAVSGMKFVGGFAGGTGGTIVRCYATGQVIRAEGCDFLGGFAGQGNVRGFFAGCLWDTQASGIDISGCGIRFSTARMTEPDTYSLNGWTGDPNWVLDAGRDYPRLAWEGSPGQVIGEPVTDWLAGSGTQEDPYQIATADQLALVGSASLLWDKAMVLTADLDVNGIQVQRIGVSPGSEFRGSFDGREHTIRNLTMNSDGLSAWWMGLFGWIHADGRVSNLNLENAVIRAGGQRSGYLGALAGLNHGAISNCTATDVFVEGQTVPDGTSAYVGGLIGYSDGNVEHCRVTGNVRGDLEVGGLIGLNRGSVLYCRADTAVSGRDLMMGGLIGANVGVFVRVPDGDSGGRFPGHSVLQKAVVKDCCAMGQVAGDQDSWEVGGLVGRNQDGDIVGCYANGDVSGDYMVGGLVGGNKSTISMCYATGRVVGNEHLGGLVGWDGGGNGEVVASFWDIDTTGHTPSGGGTGKTTAEMQTAKTFLDAGWDFVGETANGTEDVWWIEEGEDYPRLWWEPGPPVRLPVVELDAAGFDAGIAQGVVLVDFFATWCPPCRTQGPILEEVADRLEGRAQVVKLDVDKARSIMQRYNVTAIPTLILFREGIEVKRFVGVTGADVLVAAVLEAVGSP